jgi:translation initiation factor 1
MSDPLSSVLNALDAAPKGKIHVRFQKNGPRSITLIEGLDDDLDLKRISKAMKKGFNCASSVHVDEKTQESYIKLQGDHRDNIREWLLKEKIVEAAEAKERIIVHGY